MRLRSGKMSSGQSHAGGQSQVGGQGQPSEEGASQVILLVDVSGSTGSQQHYWQYARRVFDSLVQENSNVQVILWDDKTKIVTHDAFRDQCLHARGFGGTYPSVIATSNMTPEDSDIIIITDGDINEKDANDCIKKVNGRHFSSATIHFVQTGGNMSLRVSAAFTGNCDLVKIVTLDKNSLLKGPETLVECSTRDPVILDQYMGNPDKFLAEFQNVRGSILMQCLGKPENIPLRNSLLDLQANLMSTLAKQAAQNKNWETLVTLVKSGPEQFSTALEMCSALTLGDNVGTQIKVAIEDLLKMCTGKDFSLANLKGADITSRLTRANELSSVAVVEADPKVAKTFECPVCLDDDVPSLCIKQGAPVLDTTRNNQTPAYIDYLSTNPLALLENQDLVEAVKARIGHPLGLTAAKKLFDRGEPKCPFSRDPLSCVFVPFSSPEKTPFTKSVTKTNIFALANIVFGKKLVGNVTLWNVVLWRILAQISYLSEFMPHMEKYLVAEWQHRMTNMTFSGLPIAPMIKAPAGIAMWYCVISEHIKTKQGTVGLAMDDDSHRLRSMGWPIRHLLPCLDLLQFYYPQEWTRKRLEIFGIFNRLMSLEKQQGVTKYTSWRQVLQSCVQNSHTLASGEVILLDGPVQDFNHCYNRLRTLIGGSPLSLLAPPDNNGQDQVIASLGLVFALAQCVDRTKSVGVVAIPYEVKPFIPSHVVNYGYSDNMSDVDIRVPIPICPKTMRPFVIDRRDGKYWKDRSTQIYGPIDKQCSNKKYFIDFIFQRGHYPTKDELFVYIADRQASREVNPVNTLPRYQVPFIDGLFRDYEQVLGPGFQDVDISKFKSLAWASMREEDRRRLEGNY